MKNKNQKLWGGRFEKAPSPILEKIGESISFDYRLFHEDIKQNRAHTSMLHKIGILSKEELTKIRKGFDQIEKEFENGEFKFKTSLEDIHMNIESRLTEIIGETGKKIHTARSRNDQVAQDVRLYILSKIPTIKIEILKLLEIVYIKAKNSVNIIIPGYTHLQVAQPIRASHYLLSYFWSFARDFEQFEFAEKFCEPLVLGSGAFAGVNYNNDREYLKNSLNLSSISENSIDAVASRDHILNFLFACSQLMIHFSRFSEEIVIYSTTEFSLISLPDELTTGSSIMPQKKNPDIAELIRGKTGRVLGNLQNMFVLLKGLPLSYNRDLQEDKIPLFDSTDTILVCLEGVQELIQKMEFKVDKGISNLENGFATATDLADFLVTSKGVPFRTAHELVGKLVQICVRENKNLFNIDEKLRENISTHFKGNEYKDAISLSNSCDKKNSYGGTSLKRQKEQLKLASKKIYSLQRSMK